MEKKETILITGATSGIGLLTAEKLYRSGYTIFGTSRSVEKNKGKVPFELLSLDVTSQESINRCIELLLAKTATVDVLINNAGSLLTGSVEETTIEQAYKLFEANFWGAVKMTKAILPVMRRQGAGKIITTGSLAGLISLPFNSYYSASKHALEGFFKSLRVEVKAFNIHVSVVEPAFFKTNIGSASDNSIHTINAYDEARKGAEDFVEKSVLAAPTPEPVAETMLKIVRSKNPKFSYPVGKSSKVLPALQFLSPGVFEAGLLKRVKLQ